MKNVSVRKWKEEKISQHEVADEENVQQLKTTVEKKLLFNLSTALEIITFCRTFGYLLIFLRHHTFINLQL